MATLSQSPLLNYLQHTCTSNDTLRKNVKENKKIAKILKTSKPLWGEAHEVRVKLILLTTVLKQAIFELLSHSQSKDKWLHWDQVNFTPSSNQVNWRCSGLYISLTAILHSNLCKNVLDLTLTITALLRVILDILKSTLKSRGSYRFL